jgi:hypothetical protein
MSNKTFTLTLVQVIVVSFSTSLLLGLKHSTAFSIIFLCSNAVIPRRSKSLKDKYCKSEYLIWLLLKLLKYSNKWSSRSQLSIVLDLLSSFSKPQKKLF